MGACYHLLLLYAAFALGFGAGWVAHAKFVSCPPGDDDKGE